MAFSLTLEIVVELVLATNTEPDNVTGISIDGGVKMGERVFSNTLSPIFFLVHRGSVLPSTLVAGVMEVSEIDDLLHETSTAGR